MEFREMKRNTSNWSNFCMLLRCAGLSASAGLSCSFYWQRKVTRRIVNWRVSSVECHDVVSGGSNEQRLKITVSHPDGDRCKKVIDCFTQQHAELLLSSAVSTAFVAITWNNQQNADLQSSPVLELQGLVGGSTTPPPQFMSTDAHFWVKIGFKFQSMGKISNISSSDLQFI